MKVCVLASGSKGNCIYVERENCALLVDLGISYSRLLSSLAEIGGSVEKIKGVLVTHEHIDHIKGLSVFAKKNPDVPVISHQKTLRAVDEKMHTNFSAFARGDFESGFSLCGINIQPFRTSHDAVCPVGYTLESDSKKVAVVTDLGFVTPSVRQNVLGCSLAVLEFNHDHEMLFGGDYPQSLKVRIGGRYGHLSNELAADFAVDLIKEGARNIILAHLSEENNLPSLAKNTLLNKISRCGLCCDGLEIETAMQKCHTVVYEVK